MLRFILLIILCLGSLLCIFRAPTYHLWMVAIMVTEFGWIFITATAVLLACGFFPQKLQLAGTVIGITALILFTVPIINAMIIASKLPAELDAAFGNDPVKEQPFRLRQMISGINAPQVTPKTFIYTQANETELSLDYYASVLPGKKPCIVVVHGGSWAGGDSKQLPELNTVLANNGYQVASINYRLAPQYKSPAPVADIAQALAYLKQHSNELQIDTGQMVLLGRSAGAQLALIAAYTLHDPSIKGIVNFYGPADMVWGYSLPANPLVMDSRKVMEDFLGGTFAAAPKQYYASSPVEFVNSQTVPTLSIHGKNDPLVAYEHSIRLTKKLNDAGVKNYFLSLPWGTHGCDYTLNGPGGQLSTYSVLRFLKAVVPVKQ